MLGSEVLGLCHACLLCPPASVWLLSHCLDPSPGKAISHSLGTQLGVSGPVRKEADGFHLMKGVCCFVRVLLSPTETTTKNKTKTPQYCYLEDKKRDTGK